MLKWNELEKLCLKHELTEEQVIVYLKRCLEVGVKKPNPKVFEYALEKANTNASSSIMIGDNIEADIQGAINCGIRAIHYNSEKSNTIPDSITSVNHLLEIKQYL